MDRLIYTAMTGAKHILDQQATTTHNLANATSTGFRAQLDTFRAVPIVSDGLPTRVFVVDATAGADFSEGPLQHTGRPLDIAVQGKGWIAVQAADGSEAYTRSGGLKISETGLLQTAAGEVVQGTAGTLTIPPDMKVEIGASGVVGIISNDTKPGPATILGNIKLVNPPESKLVRGDDGLFRLRDGGVADNEPTVKVLSGALEGSNVSAVDSMVSMISLARQFETQMSLLKNAENNATKATQILALN
jgi:flagellar basal-body rod protein FlgF